MSDDTDLTHVSTGPYRRPDWDSPPSADQGEIGSVEFHNKNALAVEHHVQPCQACEEPVPIAEDHVLAMIRVFDRMGGNAFDKARFCDRECWIDWAQNYGRGGRDGKLARRDLTDLWVWEGDAGPSGEMEPTVGPARGFRIASALEDFSNR